VALVSERASQRNPFSGNREPLIPKMRTTTIRRFHYLEIPKKDREAPYLVREFVRCGKPICRCNQGIRHGPYTYLRYEEWDAEVRMERYRREYVPKAELPRVRRWIRRYRADAAFGRGVMGLVRRYVAGVEARRRRAVSKAEA
jgi:hypothetical protein